MNPKVTLKIFTVVILFLIGLAYLVVPKLMNPYSPGKPGERRVKESAAHMASYAITFSDSISHVGLVEQLESMFDLSENSNFPNSGFLHKQGATRADIPKLQKYLKWNAEEKRIEIRREEYGPEPEGH